MKRLILATALVAMASSAYAADAKPEPAKPTCGADAKECQKVVDELTGKLGVAALQVNGLQRQRDAALTASANTDLNAFVIQQQAAIAATPVPANK